MAYPIPSLQNQPTIGLYQVLFLITLSLGFAQNASGQESPTVSIAPPALAAGAGGHLFEIEGDPGSAENVPGGAWVLTRTGDGAGELTVNVTVTEIGDNFVPTGNDGAQTVTFADGETTARYRPIEDDGTRESHGLVTVALATGGDYEVDGANNSAAVLVRDDDKRIEFTFDPPELTVVEGEDAQFHAEMRTRDIITVTEMGDVARVLRIREGPFQGQTALYGLSWSTGSVEAESPDDYGSLSIMFSIAASDFAADGNGGYVARKALQPVRTVSDTDTEGDERLIIKLEYSPGLSRDVAIPAERSNISDLLMDGSVVDLSGNDFIAAVLTITDPPPSNDASLSGLTLTDTDTGNAIELDPTFSGDELEYTAQVPADVQTITMDATANHSGATLEYMNGKEGMLEDMDPDTDGFQIGLMVGANPYKVQVEAENGMKQTYTVIVTRQGPPFTVSLDTIAGDDVVNIREKADGFTISGSAGSDKMGSMQGTSVMVDIGSGTLTATTDSAGDWSVEVPSAAEYLSEPGVTVTVNASGMYLTDAPEVMRELAVDLTPPALESATVEGDRLTLTFDETLAERAVSPGAFSVSVNGEVQSGLIAVGVGGDTVTLALDLPVTVSADDTVTLSYVVPAGSDLDPIKDAAGNEALALTDHPVNNNTKPGEQCAGSDESLRLADGGEAKEGRVEVCADDDTSDNTPARWGTVCDDYWTNDDADVACRVLGYERSEPYAGRFRSSYFGAGTGPIWLDDMLCRGSEANLLDCPLASGRSRARDFIGVHNCKSNEVVGVRCIAAGDVVRPYANGSVDITGTGADGHYEPGDTIRVTLTFTEAVTVDTAGGTPVLGLALGGYGSSDNRRAPYTDGSGTRQLVFEYRVASADGEFSELQVESHSLVMNGGTIRNTGGVDVLLVNPSARVSPETNPHAASLSVADATAEEGARLEFRVALSRAADRRVSVSYHSEDGTATAGSDYEAVSGTLIFAAGETAKTVTVATLDDVVDDDGETLTLRLTSYSGAYLEDSEATGTIHNSDPLPKGWMSRFGRTSAAHVVDMLDARFDEAVAPASQLTLGGQTWRVAELRDDPQQFHNGAAVESNDDLLDYTADWSDPSRITGPASTGTGSAGIKATPLEHTLWGLLTNSSLQSGKRRFISQSSFNLSLTGHYNKGTELNSGPGESAVPVESMLNPSGRWSLWGRGALTHFGGVDEGVNLQGDVLTGLLGLDYARERWLAGVALAYHDGNGTYTSTRNGGAGDLDSTLVTVNPYLRYALTERLSVWGTLGYGTGTLQLRQELKGQGQIGTELNSVPGESIETDMSMTMGALGLRGVIYASANTEMALKSDALWVSTSSEETDGMQDASAETTRIRLLLSGRHQRVLANDAMLSPSFELGIRYDDGDAETGFGMELGGGLRYADIVLGLTVETKARALLAHEDGGYEEWGVGGSLSLDPGRLGRGLALRLDSGWGMAESGAQALWQRQTTAGIGPQHDPAIQGRLTAELGYGLDVPWTYGSLTPYSGMEWAGANRTLRLGWRFTLGQSLSFSLDGERREDGHTPPEHALMLRTSLPW